MPDETVEDLNIYYDGNNVPASSDSSSDNSSDNSDTSDYVTADVVQGMIKTALSQLTVPLVSGSGTNTFQVTNQGLFLGSGTFATAPFSVTMAGVLSATGAIISGSISATSGTIGGFMITSTTIASTGLILTSGVSASLAFGTTPPSSPSSGTGIYLDKTGLFGLSGGTQNFGISATDGSMFCYDGLIGGIVVTQTDLLSNLYVAGSQGFDININGNAEFNNLLVRGEFHSSTLSYQSIQVTAGSTLLALSGGSLMNDVTTLTSPSTFNVDINDPPSGHVQVFAASDILRIKDGSGNDNWFTVSSVSDQTTFFRYVCTKSSGTNCTFYAGAAVSDYGQSGQGLILSTVDQVNAPYMSIQTHAGSPWSSITEQVRIGQLNGVNGFVSSTYGISIGQITTGNYLTYDTASGKLVVNGSPLSNQDLFGDGSDGAATCDGSTSVAGMSLTGSTYSLTRDCFFTNLTVNISVTVLTNGFRLHTNGTLTNAGTIGSPGSAGGNGGNASGITAGSAGTAGTNVTAGTINGTVAPSAGTVGGTGASAGNSTPVNGGNGGETSSGNNVTHSITNAAGVLGGRGGSGGGAGAGSGGAAGVLSSAGVVSSVSTNALHTAYAAWLMSDILPGGTSPFSSSASSTGGSGGGGGGAVGNGGSGSTATGGGGGGGGGGGSQGGLGVIFARIVVNSGHFSCDGGAGGHGGNGANGATSGTNAGGGGGGAGGGGGGGAGGALVLVYSTLTNTGTITATLGSGGAAGSVGTGVEVGGVSVGNGLTGTAGTNGNAGIAVQLQV